MNISALSSRYLAFSLSALVCRVFQANLNSPLSVSTHVISFIMVVLITSSLWFFIALLPAYKITSILLGGKKELFLQTKLHEALAIAIYLALSAAWIFTLPFSNYSEGDSRGEIVDHGKFTSYGLQVQYNNFYVVICIAILFFILIQIFNNTFIRRGR